MHLLRSVVIVLFFTVHAGANTLTQSDFEAVNSIQKTLIRALEDLLTAERATNSDRTSALSANSSCLREIRDVLMIMQQNLQHLTSLVLIGAIMGDGEREAY